MNHNPFLSNTASSIAILPREIPGGASLLRFEDNRATPVPSNYFSARSGVFGASTIRLFGPDLKQDLNQIRNIMKKKDKTQFLNMGIATQKVKELLPSIGSKRSHDLALALYWELMDQDINLPEEYMSYERVRNYLENNDYGLVTVNRNELKAGILGGDLECLIGITHPNIGKLGMASPLQPGHLFGIFPKIRNINNDNQHLTAAVKLLESDYNELFKNRRAYSKLFDPIEVQEIDYMNRIQHVGDLLRKIAISSGHVDSVIQQYNKNLISEFDDIMANMQTDVPTKPQFQDQLQLRRETLLDASTKAQYKVFDPSNIVRTTFRDTSDHEVPRIVSSEQVKTVKAEITDLKKELDALREETKVLKSQVSKESKVKKVKKENGIESEREIERDRHRHRPKGVNLIQDSINEYEKVETGVVESDLEDSSDEDND